MKPLGDFLRDCLSDVRSALPPPMDASLEENVRIALREVLPSDQAEPLANNLQQYASSPEFAEQVNRSIPPPKTDESEEQFIERAKAELKRLLLKKFT